LFVCIAPISICRPFNFWGRKFLDIFVCVRVRVCVCACERERASVCYSCCLCCLC
jgi:hypothetical protein